jgi:hypothetical protein
MKCFLLLSLMVAFNYLMAQQPYPQGYFAYPVNKAKVGIVANFGELRPNHWHMGLDCRTDAKENYPIVAAAEGYISKVKIEPYGFGNAIYIAHPNGFTTLYAHLNTFYPELQAYIKEQQYALKSWKIFIDLPVNKFKVSKGQFIANSGNTGGSQGPHLHFEIRDSKTDKVLNPLRFGFNLPDNVKPTITKLVIYDRNKSLYEQTPITVALQKNATGYFIKDTLKLKTDCISVGIQAYDQISNTPNQIGIFAATIFDNTIPMCGFRLDSISYSETRFLNAHIDYKMKYNGGNYTQLIFALPGNTSIAYQNYNIGNGHLDLSDLQNHALQIIVADAAGNQSNVNFNVKKASNATSLKDSVAIPSSYFLAGKANNYNNNGLKLLIPEGALYDRINPIITSTSGTISNAYNIHYAYVPLHSNIKIGIQATTDISQNLQNKVVLLQNIKNQTEGFAATLDKDGYYYSEVKSFGNYSLAIDTTAPNINATNLINNGTIKAGTLYSFVIKDNYSAIKNAEAYLDDTWLLLGYKGANFYWRANEPISPGMHTLKIIATDAVGNTSTKIFTVKF